MVLKHESPLSGFAADIGGSAGPRTHGGTDVQRPAKMPSKADADYVVSSKAGLLDTITVERATIYIDDDIDVTGVEGQEIGDGITLVGGFCDPNIPGRGPVIHSDEPSKYVFTSSYGEAPTLWGVSFKGPETSYKDPDHTADDFSETFASALFCYDDDTLNVYGCEFYGWTLAGLLVGAKNHETAADIDRCSFHHCQMEHLGYGIQHYNGFLSVDRCFFDKCRHGISSFGYPTGGYAVANSVIGPGPWCGHALDMHCLANNLDTDDRTAGEFVRVYRCTLMSTWDRGGFDQEGLAIRGEPVKTSYADKCHFHHPNKPTPTGGQGDAFRQETGWSDTPDQWRNFEPRDNVFGEMAVEDAPEGYGAPRAETDPEPDPDPAPHPTMDTLTIHGHGPTAQYRITIDGTAKLGKRADRSETVTQNDDGTTTLSGHIVGLTDSFEISPDATLLRAEIDGPMSVSRNGQPVDLGMLVALGDGDSTDMNELRNRVTSIESTLEAIKNAFSD
jgi:hypothetical protein